MSINAHAGEPAPDAQTDATTIGSLRAVDLTLSFGTQADPVRRIGRCPAGQGDCADRADGLGQDHAAAHAQPDERQGDRVPPYGDVLLNGRSIWHPAVEVMSLRPGLTSDRARLDNLAANVTPGRSLGPPFHMSFVGAGWTSSHN